ncbi:helix-turn-helix transcriptional regulator [Tepidicaulis sp. LMO-SS28]|uniref:helix-turn-helix transcriptional regulator n=1 Tax=Tepidicaulis sp. LMO-SS28 TaxID=3447455 RepID=UPI003EE2E822
MGLSFAEFIQRIQQSTDSSAAFSIWLEGLEDFGLDRATLGYVVPGREPGKDQYFATNYNAEWLSHYTDQHYGRFDIPLLLAEKGSGPFSWNEALAATELSPFQKRLYGEASEFGLRSGISSSLMSAPGYSAVYSVASSDPNIDCERIMAEVHARTAVLHKAFMDHLSLELAPAQPLSPREQEVLTQWARGKTAWEISQLLGVSQETVKFHLKNCYSKLGAYGRIAIVKALYLGLITIDPNDISFGNS